MSSFWSVDRAPPPDVFNSFVMDIIEEWLIVRVDRHVLDYLCYSIIQSGAVIVDGALIIRGRQARPRLRLLFQYTEWGSAVFIIWIARIETYWYDSDSLVKCYLAIGGALLSGSNNKSIVKCWGSTGLRTRIILFNDFRYFLGKFVICNIYLVLLKPTW